MFCPCLSVPTHATYSSGAQPTPLDAHSVSILVAIGAFHTAASPPIAWARNGGVVVQALVIVVRARAQVAVAIPHNALYDAHVDVNDGSQARDQLPTRGEQRLVVQPPTV